MTTGTPTTSAFTSSSSFEIWLVGERGVLPSASTGELKKPKVELAGAVLEKGTGAPVGQSTPTMSPLWIGSGVGRVITFVPTDGAVCPGPVPAPV